MPEVNGIVLLDKAISISSNFALQQVKRKLGAKKAGHTGSLDPLATGLLPICLGEATKFTRFLLDSDKRYQTRAKLGFISDTLDCTGTIEAVTKVSSEHLAKLDSLNEFKGDIEQIPPMYSALKQKGTPLYRLAREGKTVERPARKVSIYHLEVLAITEEQGEYYVDFDIHVSKGTYIRSLIDSIGTHLGCGAMVVALRRTEVGRLKEMITLENLSTDHIQPLTMCVSGMTRYEVDADQCLSLRQGRKLPKPQNIDSGWVAFWHPPLGFIGVGEVSNELLSPRRLLAHETTS